jgi:hypothetical protein
MKPDPVEAAIEGNKGDEPSLRESPTRVQLRRTKGWKMPPNTVRCARPEAMIVTGDELAVILGNRLQASTSQSNQPTEEDVERMARAYVDVLNVEAIAFGWGSLSDQARRTHIRAMRAALAVLPGTSQSRIPDGWQLVPTEPTEAMRIAAIAAWATEPHGGGDFTPVWKAMIAAALAKTARQNDYTLAGEHLDASRGSPNMTDRNQDARQDENGHWWVGSRGPFVSRDQALWMVFGLVPAPSKENT